MASRGGRTEASYIPMRAAGHTELVRHGGCTVVVYVDGIPVVFDQCRYTPAAYHWQQSRPRTNHDHGGWRFGPHM